MGSPPGTESKYGDRFVQQHEVKLTRGYWMQATEVTQTQYATIMGRNPSFWNHGSGKQHPVERVTWGDAARFCEELTGRMTKYWRNATLNGDIGARLTASQTPKPIKL